MTYRHYFYGTIVCPCCAVSKTLPAHRVRRDARVYLADRSPTEKVERRTGSCVGVVWTARPLTADPGPRSWGPAIPDEDLKLVLELYRRAYTEQTGERPNTNHYLQVLHLCHIPRDEEMGNQGNPWGCGYHESVPDDPQILIAAWGQDHGPEASTHALDAIRNQLENTKWDRNEMLFFIQDHPPDSRTQDKNDRRPILPRPLEELVRPLALGDPAFQARMSDLATSLRTNITVSGGTMESDE